MSKSDLSPELITVIVNGEPRDVPADITISQLLQQLGLVKGRIAVELNQNIVSRPRFDEIRLSGGDRLELVTFVGGG